MRRTTPSDTPRRRRSSGAPPESQPANVPLRLSVAGGRLGLELYAPMSLGPLVVDELSWSLPGLRFPVDLSGGVNLYRHRRGELERLSVRASFALLAEFARPRLRDVLGKVVAAPGVWALPGGVGIGLAGERGSLAFELYCVPVEQELRLVVANARGSGEVDVPLAHALRVVDTLFAKLGRRQGRMLVVPDAAAALAREVAPTLGARAPHVLELRVEALEVTHDGVRLAFRAGAVPAPMEAAAVRALELAMLVNAGDDALAAGSFEDARAHYLTALERAPRHPELTANIAQIDAHARQRAEAALSLLTDCLPATQFGAVGARLLAEKGDLEGARQAVVNAASSEVYAPVAAGLWLMLAGFERDRARKGDAIERALACMPGSLAARWARFEQRLAAADESGALADAEHLEAAVRGPRERHAVLVKCAERLLEHRYRASAGKLYQRALGYVPDQPQALYGLALSLAQASEHERAAALLARAIELAEARREACDDAHLELARLLAEEFDDQPQAIAHAGRIPSTSARALEARALEGRWRAKLGDLAGATLAFAALRDGCEARLRAADARAASWLVEAARFELELMNRAGAERHLACALRLAPADQRIRKLYRQVAELLRQGR